MSTRPDTTATDAHGIPPVGRTRQPRSRRRDPDETGYGRAIPADRPTTDFSRQQPGRMPRDRPTIDGLPRVPGRAIPSDDPTATGPNRYGPPLADRTNPNGYRPYVGDHTNPNGYRPATDQTNPHGYRPFVGDHTNPNGYRPATADPAMPNGYPPPRPPNFSGPDYGMPPPSGIPYGAPYGAPPGPAPSTGRPQDFRQPGAPYPPGRDQPASDRGRPGPNGTRPQGPPNPRWEDPRQADPRWEDPRWEGPRHGDPRHGDPRWEGPRRAAPPYNRPDAPTEPQSRVPRGRIPDDRATTPHETGRWSSSRSQWVPAEPREERSDFAIERFEETTDLRRTAERDRQGNVIDGAGWTERHDQRPEWHPHTWDHAPTSRSTDWSESPLPQPPSRRILDPEPERDPVASELMGERVPAGTVSAALAPLIWFGLAIVAYLVALFVFNDSAERAEAIDAGINALPWLGVASTMSIGLSLAFRWIGAGWKVGGLGFAAAVVSGTLTTVLNSLIFG